MDILTFLQSQGKSRRKIVDLILAGAIKKNGSEVSHRKEEVTVGDRINVYDETYTVQAAGTSGATIILFNKPMGYVVSKSDPHNKTIYDILPEGWENKYYYMGRLDKESHGLVVLTDSSPLVSHFSHPRYMHAKEYIIRTSSPLSKQDIADGVRGVDYTDPDTGEDMVLEWQSCKEIGEKTYSIILNEGKKRHIRRLCDVLGVHVVDLQRNTFGPWKLGNLGLREWSSLSVDGQDLESLLAS